MVPVAAVFWSCIGSVYLLDYVGVGRDLVDYPNVAIGRGVLGDSANGTIYFPVCQGRQTLFALGLGCCSMG